MDLREAILSEHSKQQTRFIAQYIGVDTGRFARLMALFLGNEYRVTQYAGWIVSECCDQNPWLIEPYVLPVLKNLQNKELHNAVRRNSLRVLQYIDLPEEAQGIAADTCFKILADPSEAIAPRVFAMTVLDNLCKTIPEFIPELLLHLEPVVIQGTPALISRGKKILAKYRKTS